MSFYIHLSIVLNPFSRKIITSSYPSSPSSKLNHNIALLISYSLSLPGGNPTRSDCQRLGLEEQHQGKPRYSPLQYQTEHLSIQPSRKQNNIKIDVLIKDFLPNLLYSSNGPDLPKIDIICFCNLVSSC